MRIRAAQRVVDLAHQAVRRLAARSGWCCLILAALCSLAAPTPVRAGNPPDIQSFHIEWMGGEYYYFYGYVLDEDPDDMTILYGGCMDGFSSEVGPYGTWGSCFFCYGLSGFCYAITQDIEGQWSNTYIQELPNNF